MTDDAEATDAAPKAKSATVTRKELAARVQKATGAKLRDVQVIMRATLEAMAQALKAGEHLRLPPFGAARVLRQADAEKGSTMRVAVREVQEKERPPRPERPAKPARATKTAAPRKSAKAKSGRARDAKQALAAKGEAE